MRVLSLCEYLMDGDRRPDHFTPFKIVQAVKGHSFKGYAWITIDGERQKLETSNNHLAITWAVERLSKHVFAKYKDEAITIVPVPGHAHTMPEEVEDGRVYHLGSALAQALRARGMKAHPYPLLYWKTAIQSAREGGSRDPDVLAPQLGVIRAKRIRKVILIDDVVTSGGHIAAAHVVLSAAGHDVADVAFAVGRTVYTKGDPLKILIEKCPRPMADVSP